MKDKIKDLLTRMTAQYEPGPRSEFTTAWLAQQTSLSRNAASEYLNQLCQQRQAVKINTRPVYYLSVAALRTKGYDIDRVAYDSFEQLNRRGFDFQSLIGANGSLYHAIEQCKAAVSYPPNGLPVLLTGPTGTGKSLLARTMFDYAVRKNLIAKDRHMVTVNCSEYANNPELLTANLFGYCKGAFTGADKDRPGLLDLADGGMLFLDEVHALKAECQEKLFLFMDKGVYHRLGDNEHWYHSQCRLVFATTEAPEHVLLKTLLRRIPVLIVLPSLAQRGQDEKNALLCYLFQNEAKEIGQEIELSYPAFQILMNVDIPGNIGGLINTVKVSCANAFLQSQDHNQPLQVFEYHLPDDVMRLASPASLNIRPNQKDTLLPMTMPRLTQQRPEPLLNVYRLLLDHFEKAPSDYITQEFQDQIDRACEEFLTNRPDVSISEDFLTKMMDKIASIAMNRTVLKISNNGIYLLSGILAEYFRCQASVHQWDAAHRDSIQQLSDTLASRYPLEYRMAREIAQNVSMNLDIQLDTMCILLFMMVISEYPEEDSSETAAYILCHGLATASSIANTVNRMLGKPVFSAIDLELNQSSLKTAEILNRSLLRKKHFRNLLLLVDMGSLEELYTGLHLEPSINVGVINNVNTKLALEIGSRLMNGDAIDTILSETAPKSTVQYRYISGRQKEMAILTVCSTGQGATNKIIALFESSLPKPIEAKIIPCDYNSLRINGTGDPLFQKYNVLFVLGTLDARLPGIPFVSIEDLALEHNLSRLSQLMKPLLSEQEIARFSSTIVNNFTLNNLVTNLTILNAEKVLKDVEDIVSEIEQGMHISLPVENRIGLYVHIACLIERLILRQQAEPVQPPTLFLKDHADFVNVVRRAFTVAKYAYSVEIPDSEIVYIYNYIENIR